MNRNPYAADESMSADVDYDPKLQLLFDNWEWYNLDRDILVQNRPNGYFLTNASLGMNVEFSEKVFAIRIPRRVPWFKRLCAALKNLFGSF